MTAPAEPSGPPGSSAPAGAHTRFGPALLALFGFALLVRLLHLWEMSASPLFAVKMIDARAYDAWAQRIAGGDWIGSEAFYQAPLYPYFMGAIYALVGSDPMYVRIAQALLGALSCALIAIAGRRLFSLPAGIAAGAALAVYAPAIFFDGLIQKSTLDLFFLSASLCLLAALIDRPRGWLCLALGATLGCFVLTRENALVFVPPIVLWLATRDASARERGAWVALLASGIAIAIAPVAIRNRVVTGDLQLTTSQAGLNFYIGNNPQADGTFKPLRPGRSEVPLLVQDYVELAEQAEGRRLSPAEVSRHWTARALAYIREQPADWLRLLGWKVLLEWNAAELVDTEDLDSHADWSRILRFTSPILHFGVLAPLAMLGVCLTWGERRRLWPLYLLVACYAGGVAVFYVVARYRYPLVPFLILFAAAGVVRLPLLFGWSRARRLACLCGVAVVAVACNWSAVNRQGMRAITYMNLGATQLEEGRSGDAVESFATALTILPELPLAHQNLGQALLAHGDAAAAVPHFEWVLSARPRHLGARMGLGRASEAAGQLDAARRHYERVLELQPDHAEARDRLEALKASEARRQPGTG